MPLDAWLPVGYRLPDETKVRFAVSEGVNWQIYDLIGGGRALVVLEELANRWIDTGLIIEGFISFFDFCYKRYLVITCRADQVLCSVLDGNSPNTKDEALSFAMALKATRNIDVDSPLQDALYIEKISRLLPTYSITARTDDDVVLGYWLTGGTTVSAKSFRRLRQTMSWLNASFLQEVVQASGFEVTEIIPIKSSRRFSSSLDSEQASLSQRKDTNRDQNNEPAAFELAGRPDLAAFFNEHIVDIIQNRDRYMALGIEFPSAVVLHGPPGCGKTFAVERLIDFLGWPSFQIDASSIASPYIHETSKKVAELFDKAIENAPSVLVIDEMEAFLADRENGSGHHRVEEVAEFLRRIPEATKNDVLVVSMTNRVDMIDPAILRRGRFDHVVKVDYASEIEVLALLDKLLSTLPKEDDVEPTPFAKELAGRPLSDVAFIVREGARLAARSGKDRIDQDSLLTAMYSAPARENEGSKRHSIGFIR